MEADADLVPQETFLDRYKLLLVLIGLSLMLVILGFRLLTHNNGEVEFIESSTLDAKSSHILVDIQGAVESPGVVEVSTDARIQDVFVKAGGLALNADREWVAKYINLAAKVSDGTKLYIPEVGELSDESAASVIGAHDTISKYKININSASNSELEELPGIGEVTAEKIVSGRPYGTIEDMLTRKIVNQAVFEKIKELISTY